MPTSRPLSQVSSSQPTLEGAGVHLRRAFGFRDPKRFDPFLLLDDFRNDDPQNYQMGFPWHPHRGIETITYMLQGDVEHGDSLGNQGVISTGDVQWMTAGSGIIHQEMPKGDSNGIMHGFQLWANLPAAHKMMPPRYRDVRAGQIPEITQSGGARVRIIAGTVDGVSGPVGDVVIEPEYLDVRLPAGVVFNHPTPPGHTAFAYIHAGAGAFGPEGRLLENCDLVLFEDGDFIQVAAGEQGVSFLFVSGKPLHEQIAWYGPIVMNTQAELRLAYAELQDGSFIKSGENRTFSE